MEVHLCAYEVWSAPNYCFASPNGTDSGLMFKAFTFLLYTRANTGCLYFLIQAILALFLFLKWYCVWSKNCDLPTPILFMVCPNPLLFMEIRDDRLIPGNRIDTELVSSLFSDLADVVLSTCKSSS